MQALLSFDQSPPIGAPFRFFLTAPLFAILAGVLLVFNGPETFSSRWTPSALALTHLMTAGFMLQVMLGALQQLLPVVVGVNLSLPSIIAKVVHAAVTPGALLLAVAFLVNEPILFGSAVAFLVAGVAVFLVAAAHALYGVTENNPTILGFRISFFGLCVTTVSGSVMAVSVGFSLNLPLALLTDLHLGWGFMVWGCTLLVAVAFVAIPMFQLTPAYPAWFARWFANTVVFSATMWTIAELADLPIPATLLNVIVVMLAGLFGGVTLHILQRSKRTKRDASHYFWTVAMSSALLACTVWLCARFSGPLDQWRDWPQLFGVLILFGCFMSAIVGMLYKIVPFLVWLHLQNQGSGRVRAPNVKKVLPQFRIDRQMYIHFLACTLLLLSVFWPTWFVYPAGLMLIIANVWLLLNLLYATRVYRRQLTIIERAIGGVPVSVGSSK